LKREALFERDGYRCVYCAQRFPAAELTVDHVQARQRGGDGSGGNLVTACGGCNVAKGHRRLGDFLAENAVARENFLRLAVYVWPRHLRALEEEIRLRRERGERNSPGIRRRST
jgi:hypothetical protein